MSCINCGKVSKNNTTIRLPHGQFEVCGSHCKHKVVYGILGYFPILGFNLEELLDHDVLDDEDLERLDLNLDDEYALSRDFNQCFWDDDIGKSYADSAQKIGVKAEEMSLRKTPRDQLPLKIGTLKFEENEQLLEELIKRKE
jgi:hypothetical protein